jgi:hypothetical protein
VPSLTPGSRRPIRSERGRTDRDRGSEGRPELTQACTAHTDAGFRDDPTIGVCFDSDRLNLWRVGITPDPKYLSTDAAVDDELQHWSRSLHGHARDWEVLLQAYSA